MKKRLLFEQTMNLFWWLRVPLFFWLRVQIISDHKSHSMKLNQDSPVLYVLSRRSITDLLVLYQYCLRLKIPLPVVDIKNLFVYPQAGYLYLEKLGIFVTKRSGAPPSPLQHLCSRIRDNPTQEVRLVPVSIIWGRDPGKSGNSLFKLLFPDEESAGMLQKLFIIIAQGRNVVIHFGDPISLREQVNTGLAPEEVAKKIRRVVRVHFQTQRAITQGPKSYDKRRVIDYVLASNLVQASIHAEAKKHNISVDRASKRAAKYLREIAASQSHYIVRLFYIILKYIWNNLYQGILVRHADALRDIANTHELIYFSSHRSHLDYMILPYELYERGLATPHTAAGVNLSFWPAGPIIRRAGGFFIRRNFAGNRLYSVVFTEYLNFLITRGHPICFFPEGGRSRTGRLLQPKKGMLSMIIRGFMRSPSKPLAFIPVYVGYDKVAEIRSYLNELRGAAKKKESLWQLYHGAKAITGFHGNAYLAFGKPVFLEEYLNKASDNWRDQKQSGEQSNPPWLTKMIDEIAIDCMGKINSVCSVSRVGLVGLAMFASPQRALLVQDLNAVIHCLLEIWKNNWIGKNCFLPTEGAEDLLKFCVRVSPLNIVKYDATNELVYMNEIDTSLILYYRNNVLHLCFVPTLISLIALGRETFSRQDVMDTAELLDGIFSIDFILNRPVPLSDEITASLESMTQLNLISQIAGTQTYKRANLHSSATNSLKLLSRLMGMSLERYLIAAKYLKSLAGTDGDLEFASFEEDCDEICRRSAILTGAADPTLSDKAALKMFSQYLQRNGVLLPGTESQTFKINSEKLTPWLQVADMILDPHVVHSMSSL